MVDAARSPFALLAVALLTAFAFFQAIGANNFPDFFIYRAGAELGLHRESPYDSKKIRTTVATQFPESEELIKNCGFFLPPQAVVVFAPFAAVPYPIAKLLWAVTCGLSAIGVLLLFRTFSNAEHTSLAARIVPVFLLLNFLTLAIIVVGQTTLLFVGCVAAGQWCYERKWSLPAALLWAIPFLKPHLALPLLPLAWYLGGWKRAAWLAGMVAALNGLGCLLAGIGPRDYLDFLAAAHKSVLFNRVELNPQITSWNRLLIAAGGPVLELTPITTLAGYLVWFGLVLARTVIAGVQPSAAWALAAAAVGSVLCSQVLGYEVLVLLLAVPWLRELFAAGKRWPAWSAILLMAAQLLPREWVEAVGIGSHRALAVAAFALVVLIGPVNARHWAPPAQAHD